MRDEDKLLSKFDEMVAVQRVLGNLFVFSYHKRETNREKYSQRCRG